ncbi:alpha/beta hydrolase [Mesorhizobium sp. M0019]|uniref:alpha/beta fold hydrolase n=2 Tax=unclassified Mesorhizobium TaxID=325217 RepID=UPI00333C0CAE
MAPNDRFGGIFNHNEDPARANGKVFRAVVAYDLNRLVSSVRGGRQEEHAAQADQTPMLYLRGDADGRGIEDYVAGIEAIGAEALTGKVISGAGEFMPLERPEAFVQVVRDFAKSAVSARAKAA